MCVVGQKLDRAKKKKVPFSSVVRGRWLSYHFVSGSSCTSRSNGWVLLLFGSRGRGVGRGRGLSLFSVVDTVLFGVHHSSGVSTAIFYISFQYLFAAYFLITFLQ